MKYHHRWRRKLNVMPVGLLFQEITEGPTDEAATVKHSRRKSTSTLLVPRFDKLEACLPGQLPVLMGLRLIDLFAELAAGSGNRARASRN